MEHINLTKQASLQTVQNAGLRSMGNLYKTYPQDFLHQRMSVQMFTSRMDTETLSSKLILLLASTATSIRENA